MLQIGARVCRVECEGNNEKIERLLPSTWGRDDEKVQFSYFGQWKIDASIIEFKLLPLLHLTVNEFLMCPISQSIHSPRLLGKILWISAASFTFRRTLASILNFFSDCRYTKEQEIFWVGALRLSAPISTLWSALIIVLVLSKSNIFNS